MEAISADSLFWLCSIIIWLRLLLAENRSVVRKKRLLQLEVIGVIWIRVSAT